VSQYQGGLIQQTEYQPEMRNQHKFQSKQASEGSGSGLASLVLIVPVYQGKSVQNRYPKQATTIKQATITDKQISKNLKYNTKNQILGFTSIEIQ
jgi:hypothetical protein